MHCLTHTQTYIGLKTVNAMPLSLTHTHIHKMIQYTSSKMRVSGCINIYLIHTIHIIQIINTPVGRMPYLSVFEAYFNMFIISNCTPVRRTYNTPVGKQNFSYKKV